MALSIDSAEELKSMLEGASPKVRTSFCLHSFELNVLHHAQSVLLLYFWADFHAACKPGTFESGLFALQEYGHSSLNKCAGGQMDQVLDVLGKKHGKLVTIVKVEAEKLPALAETYQVTMVPTFILLKEGKAVDKLEGAKPQDLAAKIESSLRSTNSTTAAAETGGVSGELGKRLDSLITSAKTMLFMKGNASEPKCKFSRAMVELLNEQKVKFASFDILKDNDVREGLKVYKNWKTFPQLYVDGQLVGGVDKVKELAKQGPLTEVLAKLAPSQPKIAATPPVSLDAKLKSLINQGEVMLFMKGSPAEPKCGFSRTMVGVLKEAGISFDSFDILEDNSVRQGLKTYSNWPTYPQLYVRGKLVGGLDIVKEMAEDGDLKEELGLEDLNAKLKSLVNRSPVMLFMKGTPDTPRCGFSRNIVELLRSVPVQFDSFDILSDESVRQGLKTYSNWPTYPQLYSKGKLLGGLDIVREMHEEGELNDALA